MLSGLEKRLKVSQSSGAKYCNSVVGYDYFSTAEKEHSGYGVGSAIQGENQN